jgi:GH25 family lysozyme M1 (1,4-beta-N-acetylmuramidase)
MLHIRDISKWNDPDGPGGPRLPDITGHIAAGNPALTIRAHNGRIEDPDFDAYRAVAHAAGVAELGIYQYLVKDRPVADQAHEFLAAVHQWQAHEYPIVDVEEGDGDLSQRVHEWFYIVDPTTTARALVYSGESFIVAHGLVDVFLKRPGIIAAYRGGPPPSIPHVMWQHTNGSTPLHPDPQLGRVDCSVYAGTINQLTRYLHPHHGDKMTLTAGDLKAIRAEIDHAIKTEVGPAVLAARIPNELTSDPKDTTNVGTAFRTMRREVHSLVVKGNEEQ